MSKNKAKKDTAAGAIIKMIELAAETRNYLSVTNQNMLIARTDKIADAMQVLLGKATGAAYRMKDGLGLPINVYERPRKDGVKPNPEFAKKGLCNYSAGIGLMCGHQCAYCSTPALVRTHSVFGDIKVTSFNRGFAIIDQNSHKRIKNNIPKNLTKDDVIQLSTIDDAWSPEARRYDLGHKVMEVLLKGTPAQIRVLTKSSEVTKDFGLFKEYGDRVIVGLSTGIPLDREDVAKVVEPNASTIRERLDAIKKAHEMGLRTFGMLCPCLPLIADNADALSIMFDEVLSCGVEDIWLEPVNHRGRSLKNTEAALKRAGLTSEAEAVDKIRDGKNWSAYTKTLIETAIDVAKEKGALSKLHILLYPDKLTIEDAQSLQKQPKGIIIWLKKKAKRK